MSLDTTSDQGEFWGMFFEKLEFGDRWPCARAQFRETGSECWRKARRSSLGTF